MKIVPRPKRRWATDNPRKKELKRADVEARARAILKAIMKEANDPRR
jgi:hypothetical protein